MGLMATLSRIVNLPRTQREGVGQHGSTFADFAKTHANVRVTPDIANSYSAYFACIRVVSSQLGMLPFNVYSRDGQRRELQENHPVNNLLHRFANPEMTAMSFRELMLQWALSYGNGYAEIERNIGGQVTGLWPLHPTRVTMRRLDGELFYETLNTAKERTFLRARDVIHLKGPSVDGLVGLSIAGLARHTVGLGLAAEKFGAEFFGNGTHLGGLLVHPGQLDEDARRNLEEWWGRYTQSGGSALKMAILEEGMTYERMGIPPEDAQFLQTREFQVVEVCRWFGVPPHKVGDLSRATFSNIEQQSIDYVNDCLMPWAVRLEQECDYKLFQGRASRMFTKHNFNALLRGDSAARANFYTQMSQLGVLSVNDVLELEDRNPIGPDGDKRLVQLNLTTLEKVGTEEEAPAPVPIPRGRPRVVEAHAALLCDIVHRVQVREDRAGENMRKGRDIAEFRARLEDFRGANIRYVVDLVRPAVLAYQAALELGGDTEEIVSAWAKWRDERWVEVEMRLAGRLTPAQEVAELLSQVEVKNAA
jgi:HK97 family phage portal protein